METPHNWENSAGLLVDRAHGHLSCRDRAPIDASARFELTPVKSRVARSGKSASFDLTRLHTSLAPWSIPRRAVFLSELCRFAVYLVIGSKYRYHWNHARAYIRSKYLFTEYRLLPTRNCDCFVHNLFLFQLFAGSATFISDPSQKSVFKNKYYEKQSQLCARPICI